MKRRTFLLNLLLILPALLLLGWWLGIQVFLRSLPQAPWVLAARTGISNNDLSGAALGGAQPAPDVAGLDVIPPRRAALIAWQMLTGSAGHNVTLNDGPTLMVVTFPDGKARLAYRAIALVSADPGGLAATAAAAYLDAVDGTPLAVLESIHVAGSDIAALSVPAEASIWVQLMRNMPLILLGLYLVLIALLMLAVSLFRRHAAPKAAPPVRPQNADAAGKPRQPSR
jgi:hypothetical protein